MLPISMVGGILFNRWIGYVSWLAPYLIFVMLTVTFTRIKPSEFRITNFQWALLAFQILGCWITYYLLKPFSPIVAEGAFLCIFISTATAAPVITGMLGGSVSRIATYCLLSSLMVALTAPAFFSWIELGSNISFMDSFTKICSQVCPLLILPLIIALAMRSFMPKLHASIASHQTISFWIWAVCLFLIMGKAVAFIMTQSLTQLSTMLYLALAALIACCVQFYIGRKIGGRFGDKVAGAQGLGQKNTVLALWLSLTYLNPLVSIAPAAYIAWQNIINSLQLYIKAKKGNL